MDSAWTSYKIPSERVLFLFTTLTVVWRQYSMDNYCYEEQHWVKGRWWKFGSLPSRLWHSKCHFTHEMRPATQIKYLHISTAETINLHSQSANRHKMTRCHYIHRRKQVELGFTRKARLSQWLEQGPCELVRLSQDVLASTRPPPSVIGESLRWWRN